MDGSIFEGSWEEDEKNGEGIFKDSSGLRIKQLWHKGKVISQSSLY